MAATPTYPGVYIEEISPGTGTISGVPTTMTGFVGAFREGPLNSPVEVLGWSDFVSTFGDPDTTADQAVYAVRQFFENGGTHGFVVRVGSSDAAGLIGNEAAHTGIHALDAVDVLNLLCVPDTANLPDREAAAVITTTQRYCERRRAFYIVDPPQQDENRDEVDGIAAWLVANLHLRSRNAAVYVPRLLLPDGLTAYAPSGAVAGVYVRTDSRRGVWRAPAGTEADLRGIGGLRCEFGDREGGVLNPLGINVIRTFSHGTVVWGARTMQGEDDQGSEWKYVPVRRMALFLEESLYRGTQWAVFEPNDEPLWAQLRSNIGSFMHNLFRKGAFSGSTPRDAYLVKCDSETTTQIDIDRGIVNILVGFAPLKPAEFVIIKIQQLAGQTQA